MVSVEGKRGRGVGRRGGNGLSVHESDIPETEQNKYYCN